MLVEFQCRKFQRGQTWTVTGSKLFHDRGSNGHKEVLVLNTGSVPLSPWLLGLSRFCSGLFYVWLINESKRWVNWEAFLSISWQWKKRTNQKFIKKTSVDFFGFSFRKEIMNSRVTNEQHGHRQIKANTSYLPHSLEGTSSQSRCY